MRALATLLTFFQLAAHLIMAEHRYAAVPGLVDLGYAKHVPTFTNTTTSGLRVAVYKNIRFGNPPTGELRFRKPDTRLQHQSGVQDGKAQLNTPGCLSTAPWYIPFLDINGTSWGHEDCLFLDVYVPEGVKPGEKVAVLHWYVGSGYAFGGKEYFTHPLGLFDHMHTTGQDKLIFVAHNYRLGIAGWTSAPGQDTEANAGLFDSLEAAKWTEKYINKFGGDSSRITAIGESADAGSLLWLVTLNGGRGRLPFQQVFIASPATPPHHNVTERQGKLFNLILDATNCSSLACLRKVPEEKLLAANHKLINDMPSLGGEGNFGPVIGFGPVPNGEEFEDIPLALLEEGKVHRSLTRIIIGHMAFEGNGTASDQDMPRLFPDIFGRMLTTASNETIQKIQSVYHYPPQLPEKLAWDWTTDIVFATAAYSLAAALPNTSHFYIMSTPPAVHAQDLSYYFHVDQATTPVDYPQLAAEFQTRLLRFVSGHSINWRTYGKQKLLLNATETFVETHLPEALVRRSDIVQQAVLDRANGA